MITLLNELSSSEIAETFKQIRNDKIPTKSFPIVPKSKECFTEVNSDEILNNIENLKAKNLLTAMSIDNLLTEQKEIMIYGIANVFNELAWKLIDIQ
ncbi:hypothetical protein [Bacillus toyonensis]|uniref:hypothetical protein n=1 Tax=Bacillus toyonensis TaxID=155322 RepID=UPI0021D08C79|nr:hypothetical protein [Bacillus toyonensis]MCU5092049.1 hypothetical protein [Bacillus toyonensis]